MGGKESMKRLRNKLRQNKTKWIEHKEKERKRVKEYRAKRKHQAKDQQIIKRVTTKEERLKNAERMRKYRISKKCKMDAASNRIPYKTKESLFKDVDRVRKVLPVCLEKKRMVLEALFQEYYPDDISYQSPDKSDIISVKIENCDAEH